MNFRERIMESLARFVCRFYIPILICASVLLVCSLIAAQRITVRTQAKDLLPENNPRVVQFEQINDRFSGGTSVIITIEGGTKQRMAACAEDFALQIRSTPSIMNRLKTINVKNDREFILDWGLILQKKNELDYMRKLFRNPGILSFMESTNDNFEAMYTSDDAQEEIETGKQEKDAVGMLKNIEMLMTGLRMELSSNKGDSSTCHIAGKILAERFVFGDDYFYSPDDNMLMFMLQPDFALDQVDSCVALINGIKKVRKEINIKYPDLQIGYTGDVAFQADEQDAVGFDLLVPTLVAFILVLFMFVFSFGQIRIIVLTMIALLCGIVFNYGFIAIAIRELTMLTSIMGALLIGMGIDYGIQFITNYTAFRNEGSTIQEAIRLVFQRAGMGIFTAAFTTAVSFFVLIVAGSKAIPQFGLVAGMGIICCYVSMTLVLPSMLILFENKKSTKGILPVVQFRFLEAIGKISARSRWIAVCIITLITISMLYMATKLKFEHDMMKLEPQHAVSTNTFYMVMDKFDLNLSSIMLVAPSVDSARALTSQIEQIPFVSEVQSISYLIPELEQQMKVLPIIKEMSNDIAEPLKPSYTEKDIELLCTEIERLQNNVIEIGDLTVASLGENNRIVLYRNAMIREIMGDTTGKPGREVFNRLIELLRSNPALNAERLNKIDVGFREQLVWIGKRMTTIDRPISLIDLPAHISTKFLDSSKTHNLITVYPKIRVTENEKSMNNFIERISKIDSGCVGIMPFMTELTNDFIRASKKGAILVLLVVMAFMLINFRNIWLTIISTLPLLLGLIWLFGLISLLGMKMDMVSMIVIPLNIGIGIAYGAYITYRFVVEKGDLEKTIRYSSKAVFLSAFTTMAGFGSLGLIGTMPTISLIGKVLFFGVLSAYLITLVLLPALLTFSKMHKQVPKESIIERNGIMKTRN